MDLFRIGERIRTTVDAPAAWDDAWGAPAGTGGVVVSIHVRSNAHGVLLDGDPSQMGAYYHRCELEAE